jgi:branched-chain amino acid transport system ATP-binding protein
VDKILKVDNATLKFGELLAIDHLSFEVTRGEILGIAGPNGAGKTTLYNLLSGVYRGQGSIIFDSHRIEKLSSHEICHRGIARTFQAPIVFNTMTVRENITVGSFYGSSAHKKDYSKRTDEIMDFFELTEKADVVLEHLRLFDKKKVMIGAALATHPKLLLLDEPLGGLSPYEILKSVEYFKKIRESGVTIIIIEHIMKFLMAMSDRMMILHNGAKIAEGIPSIVAKDRKVIEVYLGEEYANAANS